MDPAKSRINPVRTGAVHILPHERTVPSFSTNLKTIALRKQKSAKSGDTACDWVMREKSRDFNDYFEKMGFVKKSSCLAVR
jgi:hypothetical protein